MARAKVCEEVFPEGVKILYRRYSPDEKRDLYSTDVILISSLFLIGVLCLYEFFFLPIFGANASELKKAGIK